MSDASLRPEEAAAEKGMTVVRPGPSEVFVDLDGHDAIAQFRRVMGTLGSFYPDYKLIRDDRSSTYPNRHVVIDIGQPVRNAEERTVIELALGSDPIRGLLGLLSIEDGRPEDASVFFERPS